MSDSYIYPRKTTREDPESPVIDSDLANEMIYWREQGFTKTRAQLEALAICHNRAQVKRVSDALDAEVAELKKIPVDDEAKYLAAVSAKTTFLEPAAWVECMKEVVALKPVVAEVAVKG